MSFLKSFFGAMAAAEISEKKRVEQERARAEKERISNAQKVLRLGMEFLEYQTQINCRNATFKELVSEYDMDNNNVTSDDVWRTEQLFKGYKRQLKEFMSYGGDPQYICGQDFDSNKMDLYIEIVKRLKEYGWLDKQDQYVKYADDTYFLDFDWEQEQKKRHKYNVQVAAILNASGNELTEVIKNSDPRFVPYEGHQGAIVIDTAKSNDETKDNFLEFLTISIVFAEDYIIIYNYEHDEMYYKADITSKIVAISNSSIGSGWDLVELNGMSLLFSSDKANAVWNMYLLHNANVSANIQHQYNVAYENINSLSGVEFERVCKRLLENMGFDVETTKTTGDGGIDLIAYNHQPLLSGKYIIQCKRYTGSVGEPVIRDLYGVITSERANKGILMTSGTVTKQARLFAQDKPIELIDGVKMQELLKEFYY